MTLTLSIYRAMIVAVHQHSSNKKAWDRLGIVLSTACFFHCVAVMGLPLLLPTLNLFIHTPWIHRVFAVLILVITPMAFIPGYRRHGLSNIIALAYLGVAGILLGVFLDGHTEEWISHSISILGSILLITAHVQNIRHSRRANCC